MAPYTINRWEPRPSMDENPEHDLCPPPENIHGVGSKGTWQREHLTISIHIPCLWLLPMQWWRSVATLSPWWHSELKWGHKCTHLATCNRGDILAYLQLSLVLILLSHLNDGAISIKYVLKELGITPGLYCKQACEKLDYNAMLGERAQLNQRREENKTEILRKA